MPLLPPELLRKLSALTLRSRTRGEGVRGGERRSRRRGQSQEFADHRPYVPGDDLRFLDWHLYGRLDQLWVKLFEEEDDRVVLAALDASASMQGEKLDYARQVAAALAWVALGHGDRVSIVRSPELTRRTSVDGARRLFAVSGDGVPLDCDADALLDRALVAASAQLIGLSRRVLDEAVGYAKERRQFGKAIGTFQAVQHHLADALLAIKFAAPLVYRAALSVGDANDSRGAHASIALLRAASAADLCCRKSLQVHGAIGYTTELDLQLYMKRALGLSRAWGTSAWHRDRAAALLLGET